MVLPTEVWVQELQAPGMENSAARYALSGSADAEIGLGKMGLLVAAERAMLLGDGSVHWETGMVSPGRR